MKSVLLGMSGGVDSTYAVARLREMGYYVEGAVIKMHDYTEVEEAKASAESLGVALRVIDARELFSKTVIADFIESYQKGRTPNPCVLCNEAVKMRLLYEEALKSSIDYIASGHYAGVSCVDGRYCVTIGADARKDQSYMLYRLPQEVLSRLILPLGDLLKTDVKKVAKEAGMASSDRPESQEICFVKNEDYVAYIERNAGTMPHGDFVDGEGHVLGTHKGIHCYTVGQRKGLGVSSDARLFVESIDPSTNRILLSKTPRVCKQFVLSSVVYSGLSDNKLVDGEILEVKVRYLAKHQRAEIKRWADGKLLVNVPENELAITPGQSAVFYREGRVALGGIIELT